LNPDSKCPTLAAGKGRSSGIQPGRPYSYQVQLLHKKQEASGVTTTTGTCGGVMTTGTSLDQTRQLTTGGTGTLECYYLSEKVPAQGVATAYELPQLVSPRHNEEVSSGPEFRFLSPSNERFPTIVDYVGQVSTSPDFTKKNGARVIFRIQRRELGEIKGPLQDISSVFPEAKELWWRIGVRNVFDRPGPIPDAGGERYIFSEARRFTRDALRQEQSGGDLSEVHGRTVPVQHPRPKLIAPADQDLHLGRLFFTFQPITDNADDEYIIEMSTTPLFSREKTVGVARVMQKGRSELSSEGIEIAHIFPDAKTLWWRVAVFQADENPPLNNGKRTGRYLYCSARRLVRP
jgi:hypothetical protein